MMYTFGILPPPPKFKKSQLGNNWETLPLVYKHTQFETPSPVIDDVFSERPLTPYPLNCPHILCSFYADARLFVLHIIYKM